VGTNTVEIKGVALPKLVNIKLIMVVDESKIVKSEVSVAVLVALTVVIAVVDITVETANRQQSGLLFIHPMKAA
jgi:hypothetical protein